MPGHCQCMYTMPNSVAPTAHLFITSWASAHLYTLQLWRAHNVKRRGQMGGKVLQARRAACRLWWCIQRLRLEDGQGAVQHLGYCLRCPESCVNLQVAATNWLKIMQHCHIVITTSSSISLPSAPVVVLLPPCRVGQAQSEDQAGQPLLPCWLTVFHAHANKPSGVAAVSPCR